MLIGWYVFVQSVVCHQDLTSKPLPALLYLTVCVRRLRVAGNMTWTFFSVYMQKHILERAPTPFFGRLVRRSAHGRSLMRRWYIQYWEYVLTMPLYLVMSNSAHWWFWHFTASTKGFESWWGKKTQHTNWLVWTCAHQHRFWFIIVWCV